MELKTPLLTKSELLEITGIPSTTFTNWRLRNHIPFGVLGVKRLSLTRWKYSFLVAAYLKALAYHTGQNKSEYISLLKDVFRQIARQEDFNHLMVVTLSGWGKGKQCALFQNEGIARSVSRQAAFVPLGAILENLEKKVKHELV